MAIESSAYGYPIKGVPKRQGLDWKQLVTNLPNSWFGKRKEIPTNPTAETIIHEPTPLDPNEEERLKKERSEIDEIRLGVKYEDMEKFLRWFDDQKGHFHPMPYIPDWNNPQDVDLAKRKLYYDYYRNTHETEDGRIVGAPEDILPVTAINKFGETVGVLTLIWKGDKYLNKDSRVAGIARAIVDPDLKKHGIGFKMHEFAIDYAINEYKGYRGGLGAKQINVWIMEDPEAGDFNINIHFYRNKLGFRPIQGPGGEWEGEGRISRGYKLEESWLKKETSPLANEDQAIRIADIPNIITDPRSEQDVFHQIPN